MFRKRRPYESHGPGEGQPGGGEAGPARAERAGERPGGEPSRPDASAVLNRPPTPPVVPEGAPRRGPGGQATRAAERRPQPQESSSRKLIVGRDISLAGEIRSCETLVVEGRVEADLADSRALEIAESGVYKGSAVIDNADIAGHFEGELTARERLYVRATGNVHGTIRYGQLQIEQGGRLGGTLEEFSAEAPPPAAGQDAGPEAEAAAEPEEAPASEEAEAEEDGARGG